MEVEKQAPTDSRSEAPPCTPTPGPSTLPALCQADHAVSAAVNTFVPLPPELTIYSVGALHSEWRAGLADALDSKAIGAECRVRGDLVNEIDAAGVQLLLSLRRSVMAHGSLLRVVDPSVALVVACSALGASLLLANADMAETPS